MSRRETISNKEASSGRQEWKKKLLTAKLGLYATATVADIAVTAYEYAQHDLVATVIAGAAFFYPATAAGIASKERRDFTQREEPTRHDSSKDETFVFMKRNETRQNRGDQL